MVVIYHVDECIVKGGNAEDIFSVLNTWTENRRATSYGHVIGSHLVVRLILNKLLEELNEELKGIVIEYTLLFHQIELLFDEG